MKNLIALLLLVGLTTTIAKADYEVPTSQGTTTVVVPTPTATP